MRDHSNEKKTKKSSKKKEKIKEKEKEREKSHQKIENKILRPPSNQEELRAYLLHFMCLKKFDYPIDSINLFKLLLSDFTSHPELDTANKVLKMAPILHELERRNAILLQEGSLGSIPVEFIRSINIDKIQQLNREYFKDRPKLKHENERGQNDEIRLDNETIGNPNKNEIIPPPYPVHYPPHHPRHPHHPLFTHPQYNPPPLPAPEEKTENKRSVLEQMLMDNDQESFEASALEKLIQQKYTNKGSKKIDYCEYGIREKCQFYKKFVICSKVHFRKIIKPHTDISQGNCSYLDTCRHMDYCKYIHYEIEDVVEKPEKTLNNSQSYSNSYNNNSENLPMQWINVDLRYFDFRVIGKYDAIMLDPPWDIHMNLPYGTLKDNEMKALRIDLLQEEGLIFLWVTGRAMELGRECLKLWGYSKSEEIVWIKTNQLQRIIRTGRTGHWLNHSKEHCLVGIKGNPQINRNIDCDVIVSEVRETSRKPDEIYGLIERICPGGKKLELFARPHNRRPGWMSLGNQLPGVYIKDHEIFKRYRETYDEDLTEEKMEEYRREDEKAIESVEYTYNNHIKSSFKTPINKFGG